MKFNFSIVFVAIILVLTNTPLEKSIFLPYMYLLTMKFLKSSTICMCETSVIVLLIKSLYRSILECKINGTSQIQKNYDKASSYACVRMTRPIDYAHDDPNHYKLDCKSNLILLPDKNISIYKHYIYTYQYLHDNNLID